MTDLWNYPVQTVTVDQIDLEGAQAIAAIGIIASKKYLSVGYRFQLAKQWFVVTGEATRSDFLQAAARESIPEYAAINMADHPNTNYFLRISTD